MASIQLETIATLRVLDGQPNSGDSSPGQAKNNGEA